MFLRIFRLPGVALLCYIRGMKAKKLSKRQKTQLSNLVHETIIDAIVEDLGIEWAGPLGDEALQYLIDELQKLKSM